MLGAQFKMSNGLRVVDVINPRGHHLHGSLPLLSDVTVNTALSSPHSQYQKEIIYHLSSSPLYSDIRR